MDCPLESKSVQQLINEANLALRVSKEMTEQEKIEYDAEFGYTPDEARLDKESERSAKMDEMNVYQISNADIGKLRYEDIMFVGLAEGGAMGEPGAINIISVPHGKSKICHANYCYGDFNLDKFSKVFTPLQTFDCGIFGHVSGVAKGWHHVYMGAGNHLFVRDSVYPAFAAAIEGMPEVEIYSCYMEKAIDVIAQMKGGK